MANDSEIIVIGTASASAADMEELVTEALAHVLRSRQEDGCIAHGVSRDVEDPNRLVFVERWASRAALDLHFTQPGSAVLVEAVNRLQSAPPTLDIYEVATR